MENDWTPTTQQVRDGYSIDPEDEYRDPINAPSNRRRVEKAFDRWLAEHDRAMLTKWADWAESRSAQVPGITVEQIVAALRSGRQPFGSMAGSEAGGDRG